MEVSRVFQENFKSVSRKFQENIKGVSRVIQGSFQGLSSKFQRDLMNVLGYLLEVSRVFPHCFKDISRKLSEQKNGLFNLGFADLPLPCFFQYSHSNQTQNIPSTINGLILKRNDKQIKLVANFTNVYQNFHFNFTLDNHFLINL